MASSSKTTTHHHPTTDPNTTFVQADPSTFRTIVQQLTGAASIHRASTTTVAGDVMGPKKHVFKLHERRQAMKKLEIKLNNNGKEKGFLVSPVSTLDFLPLVSPSSKTKFNEEEEKMVYLQKSPLNMSRLGAEPELLTLFPLHSPRENME